MPRRRPRPVDIANIEAECYAAWLPPEPPAPAPAPAGPYADVVTDGELLREVGEGGKALHMAYLREVGRGMLVE